jgi:hypothetical protein
MHSKDHLTRTTSRCNKDGRCLYHFPHPLAERTTVDSQGRVHFRRRKEEDRWVVPYIPSLLAYLDCHIHVDVCSTVNVFIYLYKYLFKGPDRTQFTFHESDDPLSQEVPDEFKNYISGRYLSSSEAVYRIFSFKTTSKQPPVRSLTVHLENQHLGQMQKAGADKSITDLLWYFRRPTDSIFVNLKYAEFYAQYCFKTQDWDRPLRHNEWLIDRIQSGGRVRAKILCKRTRQPQVVTRIHTIPPRIGELFYMRTLLQYRPAYSFQELCIVHGQVYTTYQEAAVALGLFHNVTEAVFALEEAVAAYSRPAQLRFLFAYLLLDLPSPAINLWETFQEELSADFSINHTKAEAIRLTLQDISRYLRSQGSSLTQFGLSEPTRNDREIDVELGAFLHSRTALLMRSQRSYNILNAEQRLIYKRILAAVPNGGCFFVDGKAGRGKTFLISAICDRIRGQGQIACVTGTTALSVTLYERGRTAHSMFGIPVREDTSELVSKISTFSERAELLRQAALLVWEEFPMANKAAIECVDYLLHQIMSNELPFGNKTFVALGDFRQVAPVLRHVTAPAAVFDSSIRSSSLWRHFQILRLTHPIRNATDPEFSYWVDQVGDGAPPLNKSISLHHLRQIYSMEAAADFLFPDDILAHPAQSILHSFLSPFNLRVDEFNEFMMSRLSGADGR